MLKFDLSAVTLAITAQWGAVEAFDAMTAEMAQWYESGEYPEQQDLAEAVAATGKYMIQRSDSGAIRGTCAVYANRILKWARSGRTPRNIGECINADPGSKRGRKRGSAKPEGNASRKSSRLI